MVLFILLHTCLSKKVARYNFLLSAISIFFSLFHFSSVSVKVWVFGLFSFLIFLRSSFSFWLYLFYFRFIRIHSCNFWFFFFILILRKNKILSVSKRQYENDRESVFVTRKYIYMDGAQTAHCKQTSFQSMNILSFLVWIWARIFSLTLCHLFLMLYVKHQHTNSNTIGSFFLIYCGTCGSVFFSIV